MDYLAILFRWGHIFFAILWIGLAYWLNFVFVPFVATLDTGTRGPVFLGLVPRALYFIRFGAIGTFVMGLLLLMLVFYHGEQMFPSQDQTWTLGSWVMLAVTFLMFFPYDALARSGLGKNPKAFAAVGFIIVGVVAYLMYAWAGFGYRACQIHLGAMFGTIMVMDGVMRLVPAQMKVLASVKAGQAPDPSLMGMIMQRGKNDVYLSFPLIFTMINMHTTTVGEENWWAILVVIAVAWAFIAWLYKKSASVKGM